MTVQFIALVRWQQLRDFARQNQRSWPLAPTIDEEFDKFATTVRRLGLPYISQGSHTKVRCGYHCTIEQFRAQVIPNASSSAAPQSMVGNGLLLMSMRGGGEMEAPPHGVKEKLARAWRHSHTWRGVDSQATTVSSIKSDDDDTAVAISSKSSRHLDSADIMGAAMVDEESAFVIPGAGRSSRWWFHTLNSSYTDLGTELVSRHRDACTGVYLYLDTVSDVPPFPSVMAIVFRAVNSL